MSHTMVIRQKPNVQSTDELWLQQINYLEGLKLLDVIGGHKPNWRGGGTNLYNMAYGYESKSQVPFCIWHYTGGKRMFISQKCGHHIQ